MRKEVEILKLYLTTQLKMPVYEPTRLGSWFLIKSVDKYGVHISYDNIKKLYTISVKYSCSCKYGCGEK